MLHARKINLLFAMATNQIQQFRIRLLEDYSKNITVKLFVKIPKVR